MASHPIPVPLRPANDNQGRELPIVRIGYARALYEQQAQRGGRF